MDEKKSSKEIAKYALTCESIEELEMRMKIFVEAVLGPCSKSLAEYTMKRAKYFKAIAKDETKQLALLAGMESFLGKTRKEYAKETPLVLKVLYDADAAEEDLRVLPVARRSLRGDSAMAGSTRSLPPEARRGL